MVKDSLLVVDFDNTLFFTDICTRLASKEILDKGLGREAIRKLTRPMKSKIYTLAFTKYSDKSVPNKKMIGLLAKRNDSDIIILTARLNNVNTHMKKLLGKNKVPFDRVIYRNKIEMKMDDEEWKRQMIAELLPDYKKVELYEDKLENIMHISKGTRSKNMRYFLVKPKSIREV